MRAFLVILALAAITSCAGYTIIKPDGTVVDSGGFGDEAEGQISHVTTRWGDKIERIYSRPNRTRVMGQALDTVGTGMVAKALSSDSQHAETQETVRYVEGQKPKVIEATAAGQEKIIRATSEGAAGLEKVKQGR